MTHVPLYAASLTVSLLTAACHCQRPPLEDDATGTETERPSSGSMSSGSAVSGTTADEDDDLINQRFLAGVFHNENGFTSFGGEGQEGGGGYMANVEFRPDGTATMWMESCNPTNPYEMHWKWSPAPGPWIDITPGEGEQSLRFLAAEDVQSLRATIDDECIMYFERDGELHTFDTFKLGRACWFVRCEDGITHVDYCEGEQIPACP